MRKAKVGIEIKNWITGSVIYESDKETIKEAVVDANLRGADLKKLPETLINSCSRDMLFIFEKLKGELPGLRKALIEGRVDGTQYEGDCACLIGTLGNVDGGIDKVCAMIPFYDKGTHNPGEAWFLNIHKGDTPKNNQFAKHAVMLIDSVLKPTEKTTS